MCLWRLRHVVHCGRMNWKTYRYSTSSHTVSSQSISTAQQPYVFPACVAKKRIVPTFFCCRTTNHHQTASGNASKFTATVKRNEHRRMNEWIVCAVQPMGWLRLSGAVMLGARFWLVMAMMLVVGTWIIVDGAEGGVLVCMENSWPVYRIRIYHPWKKVCYSFPLRCGPVTRWVSLWNGYFTEYEPEWDGDAEKRQKSATKRRRSGTFLHGPSIQLLVCFWWWSSDSTRVLLVFNRSFLNVHKFAVHRCFN